MLLIKLHNHWYQSQGKFFGSQSEVYVSNHLDDRAYYLTTTFGSSKIARTLDALANQSKEVSLVLKHSYPYLTKEISYATVIRK